MECDDRDTSVFSFVRFSDDPRGALLFICNFTPVPRLAHRVALPWPGLWVQVLNSDHKRYGGEGVGVGRDVASEAVPYKFQEFSAEFDVPPLGVLIYRAPEAPPLPPTVGAEHGSAESRQEGGTADDGGITSEPMPESVESVNIAEKSMVATGHLVSLE
jgi:hypothetical protein